ncbi:MAG TPA: ABC transporter ATP-binding protein [Bacteroidales bacterium]|nr:ABC transporter ATP-binding protein [Bacteroidales bacterium]
MKKVFLLLLQINYRLMNLLKKLNFLISGYWKSVILYFIYNILTAFFSLFSIAMIIPFLRILFGMDTTVTDPGTFQLSASSIQLHVNYYFGHLLTQLGQVQTLAIVIIFVFLMILFKNIFTYSAIHVITTLRFGVVEKLRNMIYDKILRLPLKYFKTKEQGDIMTYVISDTQEIELSIISSLQFLFRDPITVLVFLISLFILNYKLTLLILLMLPFIVIVLGRLGRTLRKKSIRSQRQLGLLMAIINETIDGLRVIKAFVADDYMRKKMQKVNKSITKLNSKIFRRRSLSGPLTETLSVMAILVILYVGSIIVLKDQSSFAPETFIAYILIFTQLIPPAKNISSGWYGVQKGLASLDRIEEILNYPETIVDDIDAVEKNTFDKEINYENVYFYYNPGQYVLKNINLQISKGQTIAIVGPSGSGKSTLVDLLPRFYDVTDGRITIDGVDIRKIKLNSLHRLFAIVNQDPILFNDSIYNNIAFGRPDATYEEVVQAAKIANAYDFIMESKWGFETNIGEKGAKLSGGQRQRISIARAVLTNAPILIFDEATSSLDSESEKLVQDAINNLIASKTAIVIAHRLSTVVKADKIIVLKDGEIIESGTHKELVDKPHGFYRYLFEYQKFD